MAWEWMSLSDPDWKPPRRTRDPRQMRKMHMQHLECALCGGTYQITLHHIQLRSQGGSDSEENLVPLCMGPGTNDCHGRLHDGDHQIKYALRVYLEARGVNSEGRPS